MPFQAESMSAAHAAAPLPPASTAAANRTGPFSRSTMAPRLPRSGRRIEYGISIGRSAAITSGAGRAVRMSVFYERRPASWPGDTAAFPGATADAGRPAGDRSGDWPSERRRGKSAPKPQRRARAGSRPGRARGHRPTAGGGGVRPQPAESCITVPLAQGKTNDHIATETGRGRTTVKWHIRSSDYSL